MLTHHVLRRGNIASHLINGNTLQGRHGERHIKFEVVPYQEFIVGTSQVQAALPWVMTLDSPVNRLFTRQTQNLALECSPLPGKVQPLITPTSIHIIRGVPTSEALR